VQFTVTAKRGNDAVEKIEIVGDMEDRNKDAVL
jgi:hypothetical protein